MVQLFTEVAPAAVAASIERALLSRSINRPCYLAKTLLDEGRLVGLSSRATGNCSDHNKRYSTHVCRRSLASDEAFSRMPYWASFCSAPLLKLVSSWSVKSVNSINLTDLTVLTPQSPLTSLAMHTVLLAQVERCLPFWPKSNRLYLSGPQTVAGSAQVPIPSVVQQITPCRSPLALRQQ